MPERRFLNTRLAMTGCLVLTGIVFHSATAAAAHPSHGRGHDGGHGKAGAAPKPPTAPPTSGTVFLVATLNGHHEVPTAGGPAVGDRDGRARVLVRLQGRNVCFTAKYAHVDALTAGHIHAGAAGTNGAVKVGFFGTALPTSLHAVTGCVTQEASTVATIAANPGSYYVNLHSAAYPGGAVRGQLRKLSRPVDLLAPLRGGGRVALMDGAQEAPVLGDPDGLATGFVYAKAKRLNFAFTWSGIAAPNAGHLHPGRAGEAKPVAAELFASTTGLPASLSGVAGSVHTSAAVVKLVKTNPPQAYLNLHNAEFAKGAVRGQLFRP